MATREPAGFVIELENGYRVYHSGDTTVFGDMRLIRELYAPELAMLSIGGHFTMDPRSAAWRPLPTPVPRGRHPCSRT